MTMRLFDELGGLKAGSEKLLACLYRLSEQCEHEIRHYADGDAHVAHLSDAQRRKNALALLCPRGESSRLFSTM